MKACIRAYKITTGKWSEEYFEVIKSCISDRDSNPDSEASSASWIKSTNETDGFKDFFTSTSSSTKGLLLPILRGSSAEEIMV